MIHGSITLSRWISRPEDLGGYTTTGLVLSSVLGLYLELLLIRWISSEIRIFAYFKNFESSGPAPNQHWFTSMNDPRRIINNWRRDYNEGA